GSVTRVGTGLAGVSTGDMLYGSAPNTLAALAGNTAAAKKFLTQTGTGSASAAPAWAQVLASDIQAGTLTGAYAITVTLDIGSTLGTLSTETLRVTTGQRIGSLGGAPYLRFS